MGATAPTAWWLLAGTRLTTEGQNYAGYGLGSRVYDVACHT